MSHECLSGPVSVVLRMARARRLALDSAQLSMAIEFSPLAATNFPTGGHLFSPLVTTNLPTNRLSDLGVR